MIIKEFLPNPAGKDTEGEYIILKNEETHAVSLSGWRIQDKSGKIFYLSGSLESQGEIILPYSRTKISINNNGEELALFNKQGELADMVKYSGTAQEGRVIRKGVVLTEELREEYFDDLAFVSTEIYTQKSFSSFFIVFILVALLFSVLSVYLTQSLHEQEKKHNI